ncbi:MAG: DUF2254 family protein [Methanosarcinales archaeon]
MNLPIQNSEEPTFALVFTITLVTAELSAKYSPRMLERIFTKWTISYMFLFIASIVFPLVALIHISDLAVNVSLILGTICLILLIPYLVSFKEKLSPKNFLEDLCTKCTEAMKNLGKNDELPEEIKIIDNVVMSSYSFKDYDTFEIGVKKLCQLGIEADTRWVLFPIASEIFRRIRDIGLATIEDPRAPIIVIINLRRIGKEAIDKKLQVSQYEIISGLEFIGTEATIKQKMIVPLRAADWIKALGVEAASNQMDSVISAASGLKSIGVSAVANRMEFMGIPIAERLWFLGASVAKDLPKRIDRVALVIAGFESSVGESYYVEEGFENTKKAIKNSHPDLKPYLEKIRKSYEEQEI